MTFKVVVLEFIKLVQSALSIFDLFSLEEDHDGLLCDTTVDSIQRWTLEIGEQLQELQLEVKDSSFSISPHDHSILINLASSPQRECWNLPSLPEFLALLHP